MPQTEERELKLKFTGDTDSLDAKIGKLETTLKGFNAAMAAQGNMFGATERGILDLTNGVKNLQATAGKGNLFPDIGLVKTQVEAGIKATNDLRDAFIETIRQAKLANQAQFDPVNDKAIADAVVGLKELRKAEQDVIDAGKQLPNLPTPKFGDDAKDQSDKGKKAVGDFGEALSRAFLPLAALSAGANRELADSVTHFEDFEKTLNTIGGVADLTSEQLDKIKESSLDLGQKTAFNAQQVADSYLELAKAGFSAEESIQAMPGLLNLAAAAGGNLQVATQAVTETLRGLGLGVDQIERLSDVLAKTSNLSSTELSELIFAFKQVGPVAAQTNQPLEDTSALLGILANNAVKGADAGSDLRNIITRLGDETNKKTVKALKELNVSLYDAQGNARPLTAVFKDLTESLSKYDQQSKINLSKILGGEENLKSFLILTSQAPGTIDNFRSALDDAGGSTDALANKINQGLFKSLEQLGGAIDTVKIKIGEALAPEIKAVAESITGITEAVGDNDVLVKFGAGAVAAGTGIITLGAAISGLLLIFNPLKAELVAAGIALPELGLALGAVVVVSGLLTLALGNVDKSVDQTTRSVRDVNRELDRSNDAIVKQGQSALVTAKSFDQLAQKAKKTDEEKQKLRDTVTQLAKQFPELAGEIDDLTNGYKSLADAIRNATAQKIAFSERGKIDDEIAKVKQAQKDIVGFSKGAFGFQNSTVINENQIDAISKLQAQEKNLEDRKAKLGQTVKEQVAALLKPLPPTNPNDDDKTKKKYKDDADAANKERVRAQETLTRELGKIESEYTLYREGQYQKQRQDAKNAYDLQVLQINDLEKKLGKGHSADIIRGLNEASNVYNDKLKEIDRSENRAAQDAEDFLGNLKTQVKTLRAQITDGNPFDDLSAQLQAAQNEASRRYTETLRTITDTEKKAARTPQNAAYFAAQRAQAEQIYQFQTKLAQTVNARGVADQKAALDAQIQQNKVAQAELSGDTIKATEATRDAALAANDVLLKKQEDYLAKAKRSLELNPNNENAQRGQELALAGIKQYTLEAEKIQSDSAQKIAAIQVDAVKPVVAAIQKRLDLEGQSPELVKQLLGAYEEYIAQLKKELEITNLTAERRAAITAEISNTVEAEAQLVGQTSTVGRALGALSNVKLGTGQGATIFSNLIGGLNGLHNAFTKFKGATDPKTGEAVNAEKSIVDFLKTNVGGKAQAFTIGANLIDGIGQVIAGKSTGLKKALTTTISGALSGALSGAAAGGPIGAAVGGIFGLISGAASGSGGKFSVASGLTGLAIGGPIGFLVGGLVGAAKKAQKAQQQLQKTQTFIQKTLAATDQSDLNSLTASLSAVLKYKSGGGAAFAAKKQAAQQLQQAVDARKKAIADANTDLTTQNASLERALQKFDDTPIKNLTIDEQNQLDALTAARDKSLAAYKDSLETQALIEKQYELQRQQLYKDTAQSIIDAVIEEQNKIAELRSDTALNTAKASGDQIAIINAQLQASLTAIDNDTAAFKGAEEEKTAFLADQASKRTLAIKEAQDQANDILQQGMDILNEGLVTSQTKEQSQAARLQKLFGNLNPLGEITAGGDLVQKNLTLQTGAIQMTFQGIQDAQSLIAQLNDPTIQAKLLAALNTAIARS